MTTLLYDTIGRGYATGRRADPRWERQIHAALGSARTVLDVGAGTGNYEPSDRVVLAVEPSATMIAQRPAGSAPVIVATAEALPVPDGSFDVATAILTVHHWTDVERGVAELRRVSRRQVVLTFDPQVPFWLADYLPEYAALERARTPSVELLASLLDTDDVRTVLVPADMCDGVLAAHWRRPAAYLDARVRACCSGLARLEPEVIRTGIDRLAADLRSGAWTDRYGHLLERHDLDGGYRLLVSGTP